MILDAPQDVSITTHRSKEGILQLRCTASANPPANYTWRRENVSHPGNVTLQPSDVLMVPNTDPDVLDQYVCETNNSVGGERGIIYIYTIAPGCRCHYLAVIGVLVPLLVLCAGLLWCWTRGIIRKGKCLGQMDLGKDLGEVKERTFRFRPPETAVEDPYEFKEENKYVDVPLEAEETSSVTASRVAVHSSSRRPPREQMQDRMNREAEERSLEASGKSIALVTSFEKEQSHLDPSKDLKEAEDA
uniref:Ig-like domain-containing protein n=1 Tax=Leptobrachium leishanense TaxID=445787 RepID=A0A8C5LMX4_9ANUR